MEGHDCRSCRLHKSPCPGTTPPTGSFCNVAGATENLTEEEAEKFCQHFLQTGKFPQPERH